MFASEYSRQQRFAFDPQNWWEAFPIKSNSLADKNRGNLTNWWLANCSEIWTNSPRATFADRVSCNYFQLVMIKSPPPEWGPNFAPSQSQTSEARVCVMYLVIYLCVCVNCMCTPPISIQFQRLILQCTGSFARRSDASCVCVLINLP